MTIDTEHFKQKLEVEKAKLEGELLKLEQNQEPAEQADENVLADSIEELEENQATATTLDARLKDVRSGLDKIKHNVFGICQICKKEIELDRLEANPAARTCKEHISEL